MCRTIKTLFNFRPPASGLEIRDASLKFVRKRRGFNVPSKTNEAAFGLALEEGAATARRSIGARVTPAGPRCREVEADKARLRPAARFEQFLSGERPAWRGFPFSHLVSPAKVSYP